MTFFLSARQRIGAHALCVQHSPTAAALSTSFLLNHAPNSPELSALITRFRESYSSLNVSRESKRLKKSRSDWLNSGNSLIQHLSEKNAIPPANILIPLERQLIALQLCRRHFYIMKLRSRLLVLYCRNCMKDDKFLGIWSQFWGS